MLTKLTETEQPYLKQEKAKCLKNLNSKSKN